MPLHLDRAAEPAPDPARLLAPTSRQERSELTAAVITRLGRCQDQADRKHLIDHLILLNRGVAEALARRYRDRGVAQDDLTQTAYMGLAKAAQRFDPHSGNDFLTYAVPTIRGEIQRYFRDHGWTVRPTRRVQELQRRINQTADVLSHVLGRSPSDSELIDELGVTAQAYAEAITAFGCFHPISLDQPVGHETTTSIGERLPGDLDVRPNPLLELAPVIRLLSERDRRILYLRFFEDRTQREIGVDLGVTQMQVSRLLQRILVKLRAELRSQGEDVETRTRDRAVRQPAGR